MRVEIIEIEVVDLGRHPNQLRDKLLTALTSVEVEGYQLTALAYMKAQEWASGKVIHSYTAVFRNK